MEACSWKPSHHHAFDTGSVLTQKAILFVLEAVSCLKPFIAHVFSIFLNEHDHVCVRFGGPSWQGLWHDDFLSCAVLWSARVHLESAHAVFFGYVAFFGFCRRGSIEPMFLMSASPAFL